MLKKWKQSQRDVFEKKKSWNATSYNAQQKQMPGINLLFRIPKEGFATDFGDLP